MKSEAVTAAAGAAGISLVTGSVLGLPVAALVAGFFGGVVALGLMAPASEPLPPVAGMVKRIIILAASTMTAAFLGPYFGALIHSAGMNETLELQAASFVIGAGAQVLLPAMVAALKKRIDQLGGVA